jgi:hypothetical protein
VEVAISLQFKTLESLRTPQLGLLWSVFHDKGYSRLEEHGELEPAFEECEGSSIPKVGIRLQAFDDAPATPSFCRPIRKEPAARVHSNPAAAQEMMAPQDSVRSAPARTSAFKQRRPTTPLTGRAHR